MRRGSGPAYALDHFAGAAADRAFLPVMLARAVAMGADILAASRRAGRCLVARMHRFVAHIPPTRRARRGSDDSAGEGGRPLLAFADEARSHRRLRPSDRLFRLRCRRAGALPDPLLLRSQLC